MECTIEDKIFEETKKNFFNNILNSILFGLYASMICVAIVTFVFFIAFLITSFVYLLVEYFILEPTMMHACKYAAILIGIFIATFLVIILYNYFKETWKDSRIQAKKEVLKNGK